MWATHDRGSGYVRFSNHSGFCTPGPAIRLPDPVAVRAPQAHQNCAAHSSGALVVTLLYSRVVCPDLVLVVPPLIGIIYYGLAR